MNSPHLHPSIRECAVEGDEERIRRIRSDRWIGYARGEVALKALEDLLAYPKRARMPNLLLVGPTNNGKTMIVEKFRRDHPPVGAADVPDGIARIPVLSIQMPPAADEMRFFGAILTGLGVPGVRSVRLSAKQDAAVRALRATGVRMLVIDEAHNVLSGTRDQQRRLLGVWLWLGNELQIPLVAAGTAEALRAIQSDDQLANRFEPLRLPLWRDNSHYRRLLATLEAVFPLRASSSLASHDIAQAILAVSEGLLGEIVSVVARAAVQAIRSGTERISMKTIAEAGFLAPTERRRVVS